MLQEEFKSKNLLLKPNKGHRNTVEWNHLMSLDEMSRQIELIKQKF